jgi:hypothetical protein
VETHRLNLQKWKSVNRLTAGDEQENNVKGKERKGKERETMHKKSQKCYISRSRGGGISVAI